MISVENARPEDQQAGLEFYYHTCSPEEQAVRVQELQTADERGSIALENLLIARWQDEIVGALLFHHQPDESAFLWPPVVRHESLSDEIADQLIGTACQQIANSDAEYIQVLLEPDEMGSEKMLLRNGFEFLSELVYLQRPLADPLPERVETNLQEVVYQPQINDKRFADVLEQTYRDTLDCPTFTAVRDGLTALRGHQFSGRFTPEKWKIYRLDGQDAGLLLLNDHPDQSAWEVVYMGVVPAFRGRGIGRKMLVKVLHDVVDSNRESVLLAVDCDNRFALQIYEETGFCELAERRVLIRNCNATSSE